jgi:hypothetical protein
MEDLFVRKARSKRWRIYYRNDEIQTMEDLFVRTSGQGCQKDMLRSATKRSVNSVELGLRTSWRCLVMRQNLTNAIKLAEAVSMHSILRNSLLFVNNRNVYLYYYYKQLCAELSDRFALVDHKTQSFDIFWPDGLHMCDRWPKILWPTSGTFT